MRIGIIDCRIQDQTTKIKSMKANYTWKTACIIRETSDATSIIFDTGKEVFIFSPGQFVNLSLKINNKIVTRSYSLCSAADEDEKPTITVKRVKGGVMSNYIIDHAAEIEEWNIEGPHGSFYPNENVIQTENIVLIAGGSGITPIFSILKYYLKHTSANVILIHANRTKEDVIFKSSLAYMEQIFKHRFIIWNCFSGAVDENGHPEKNVLKERLSRLLLKKLLKTLLANKVSQAAYFMCGPSGLLQMSEEALVLLNVQTGHVYKEYFKLPEEPSIKMKLPRKTMEVLLHHYEQTLLVQVKPRNTILEAALQDRMGVKYSCKAGTCGICVAKLTSGEVHMANNFALPDAQVKQGYILLCQSHPLDNNVTVEINTSQ